jgi:trehalose 6-phosphate phosphatase
LHTLDELTERLSHAERIRLFLDYDGTLADFAPTPDIVTPDLEVINLLERLKQSPRLRLAIISGRGLKQLQTLIPVSGIQLAGTYGIEIQTEKGEIVHRLDLATIRPALEDIKPKWEALIAGRRGYFLEDKGWTLALHARFAEADEADQVMRAARSVTGGLPSSLFQILDGHRFLEIGPVLAHKGRTVEYILSRDPWNDAVPLYIGDDARDEEAFEVIAARGGICVIVTQTQRNTVAEYCLASPQDTRRWLEALISIGKAAK